MNINNCAKHSTQVHIITVKIITLTVTIQEIVDGIHQYYTQIDQSENNFPFEKF